ncbi:hypothetical protein [Wufeng Niviventer fulvescens morbillivirus 1]|uniref:Uncharacterized protein n=1 Tax=Wufeng Niviventer fulvescens morbillivirus 1 TaxID=2877505 RepID=A0AAE8XR67_9MONO|nr:hypothetical protein [Wufeng Niviventer fulvescens morbillivirus 1]
MPTASPRAEQQFRRLIPLAIGVLGLAVITFIITLSIAIWAMCTPMYNASPLSENSYSVTESPHAADIMLNNVMA